MVSFNDEVQSWEPLSQEWFPKVPLYRDKQLEQIKYALSIPDNHLFLYGAKGLGKTMIAKIVQQDLMNDGWKTLFIPCSRTMRGALKQHIPDGEQYGEYLAQVAKKMNLLIIFDDISSMYQKPTISSWLHDINDAAVQEKSTFNLHIMLTSTLPLMVYLQKRYISDFTQSRLGFKTITFTQYTPEQIAQILLERCKFALQHPDKMVQNDALSFLALKTARLGSDMRFATRVMKVAVSDAIKKKRVVDKAIMQGAYRYEWHDFYKSQYLSMPPHKAYLLHTIFSILNSEDKDCLSTQAYSTYTKACTKWHIKPMRERMLRIYLDELEDERFIDIDRNITRVGRVTKITSTFEPSEMVTAVEGMDWTQILR